MKLDLLEKSLLQKAISYLDDLPESQAPSFKRSDWMTLFKVRERLEKEIDSEVKRRANTPS